MTDSQQKKRDSIKTFRPKFWQKLSVKVSVGIVLILGFILIFIGQFAVNKQREYMLDQLNEYGVETSEFVAEISIFPIRKFSIYQLESFVSRLEKGKLITYCEIYDSQDNPLVHQIGQLPRIEKHVPENILIFKRDIVDEGHTIGRVEIGIDPNPVLSRMEKASQYIQVVFILELIIIALAVSFFIHKSFVSPFIRLTQITEEIAVGEFTTSGQSDRNDEIGWLAKSINSMSHKLKESYQDLERKVAERTHKLEETNIKLEETIESLATRNRQSELFRRYVEELQLCENKEDTVSVLISACEALLTGDHGGISILNPETGKIETIVTWGEGSFPKFASGVDECRALKTKQVHACLNPETQANCEHNHKTMARGFCVPVIVQGNLSGALHVVVRTKDKKQFSIKQRIGENLIQAYTLFLSNLELRHTLQQESVRDPLTGLFNRRFMEETLKRESSRAKREKFSIGIIMADVDHFKNFNDTYGHDAGDTVLKKLAEMLQRGIRDEDVVCRYGGEEFILILPNTSLSHTMNRAEEIRRHVEMNMVMKLETESVKITISLGVSVYEVGGDDIEDVIKVADQGLYAAKKAGRNTVRSIG